MMVCSFTGEAPWIGGCPRGLWVAPSGDPVPPGLEVCPKGHVCGFGCRAPSRGWPGFLLDWRNVRGDRYDAWWMAPWLSVGHCCCREPSPLTRETLRLKFFSGHIIAHVSSTRLLVGALTPTSSAVYTLLGKSAHSERQQQQALGEHFLGYRLATNCNAYRTLWG
jgi:hypothetical protein